jgi:hypothetical protein
MKAATISSIPIETTTRRILFIVAIATVIIVIKFHCLLII